MTSMNWAHAGSRPTRRGLTREGGGDRTRPLKMIARPNGQMALAGMAPSTSRKAAIRVHSCSLDAVQECRASCSNAAKPPTTTTACVASTIIELLGCLHPASDLPVRGPYNARNHGAEPSGSMASRRSASADPLSTAPSAPPTGEAPQRRTTYNQKLLWRALTTDDRRPVSATRSGPHEGRHVNATRRRPGSCQIWRPASGPPDRVSQ
jgi:hypothetical protein